MSQKGFGNHAFMGAVLLSGVWAAVYIPDITLIVRQGGWMAWFAYAAGFVGIVLAPFMIILVEGDEGFGVAGILGSLLFGWLAAKLGAWLELPADEIALLHLGAAAFAVPFLSVCFLLAAMRAQKKRRNAPTGTT